MNPLYPYLARRAGHRCEYCRAPAKVFNHDLEIEHVTPVCRGGSDTLDNLALACRPCNGYKAALQFAVDPQTTLTVRLFHPRRDRWNEHFSADPISGEVFGLTATGRATIECLHLNAPHQLMAREVWIRMNLFP